MLSAHALIEPKSASTSQTACGPATMVLLRSMSATASRYAAAGRFTDAFLWKTQDPRASGVTVPITLPTTLRRAMTTYKTVLVGTDGSESSLRRSSGPARSPPTPTRS